MEWSGRSVLPAFGDLLPDEVTAKRCRAYAAMRHRAGRKPGTIWTELNHLQIVLNAARKHRLIDREISVEKPQKPGPRDRRITKPEARKLLKGAGVPHVELAVALMMGTGARSGAVLELTWDRVDFARGQIQYAEPNDLGRRKGRATVPMTDDLRRRLEEAREAALTEYVVEWAGKPVKSVKKGFLRAVERAGLKDVTPHVLRHSAATWMAEAGVPMDEIAQFLGHSDPSTTYKIYARYSPTHLREAARALEL